MNQVNSKSSQIPNGNTPHRTLSRVAAILWVAILALLTTSSLNTLIRGYSFDSNVMALLPQEAHSEALTKVHQAIAKSRDRELIILIGTDNGNDASRELALTATKRAHKILMDSQLFTRIDGPQSQNPTRNLDDVVNSKSFNFLSDESSQALREMDTRVAKKALEKLFSPAGAIGHDNLLTDPLGLFQQWKLSLIENQPLSIEDNWLTLDRGDTHFRFIGLQLKNSAFSPQYQQEVKNLTAQLREETPDELELLSSGLIVHATHGAEQAKHEISTIGLGSLLGITFILLIVFRSATAIFYIFLPLALGSLFSFSICLLIFERIHLITLAFGTSLIGIAIDYSLHYVCADRESQSTPALPRIFSGLALALVSSVTAYAAQAAAPFPGLRQMATFAALGLIGAWLTVVLILPKLINTQKERGKETVFANHIAKAANQWSHIAGDKTKHLIAFFSVSAAVLATQVIMSDDLRSLQTSPQSLIDNDIRVSRLLNAESIGSYFVVHGDSEQAVLEREELLSRQLQALKSLGSIKGHIASSKFIPSIKRQIQNHQLQNQSVYSESGMLKTMLKPTGMVQLERAMRKKYEEYIFLPLTFDTWRDSSASQLIQNHWIGLVDEEYYSVVTLLGNLDPATKSSLSSIAHEIEKIRYIDRPKSISSILQEYRESLFSLLMIAYALVTGLLLLRYGREAIHIIASPFIASLTVLAFLGITSNPLTVFHCLALLLVLGIGLDAAIFLKETQASAYTWLAVSLSSITTFLAFGLLSLSQTPVLHFFGQTVAIGIVAIWITAPFFCTSKDNYHAKL